MPAMCGARECSARDFAPQDSFDVTKPIVIGLMVMSVAVGMGLGSVFRAYPQLYTVLRWVGTAYLLYLVYRIAMSGAPQVEATNGRPVSFLCAAAFQWVNPKAWVMILNAVTAYVPQDGYLQNVLVITALFGMITLLSVAIWAMFARVLRRFLYSPRHMHIFNVAMALLLVLSLYPLVMESVSGG